MNGKMYILDNMYKLWYRNHLNQIGGFLFDSLDAIPQFNENCVVLAITKNNCTLFEEGEGLIIESGEYTKDIKGQYIYNKRSKDNV